MAIRDSLARLYKKLLRIESYAVAYRFLPTTEVPIGSPEPDFQLLPPHWNYWCADPFPFYREGEWYIFVEVYYLHHTKACLGYYRLSDPDRIHIVLDEPFHLSYPNIFEWKEQIYMIPETHNAKELRLYRAVQFPDQWELDSVLLRDIDLADSSLLFSSNEIFIETMEDTNSSGSYRNIFYRLDMDSRAIHPLTVTPSTYIDRRPAGNFFSVGDQLYHALQNCDNCYGEFMHIARVTSFNNEGLKEEETMQIRAEDLPIMSDLPFIRTHTLNRYGRLEVVDLLYNRILLLKPFIKLWHLLIR